MDTQVKRFGILTYDVPVGKNHLYSKIRSAIGDTCLMQTWSSYVFNWAFKDRLESAMEELNAEAKKRDRVQYRLLLLDASQVEEHEQIVLEAIKRLLRNTASLLSKQILKAKTAIAEATAKGEAPEETLDQVRKYACAKAKKSIEKAQKLAIVFEANSVLDEAFASYKAAVAAELALDDKPDTTVESPSFATMAGRDLDL